MPIPTLFLLASLVSAAEPDAVAPAQPPQEEPRSPRGKRSDRDDQPKEPREVEPAREPRPGVRVGPRIGGGGVLGGTVNWDLGTGTLIDLGLSLRPAMRNLESNANLMASAGVGWELWGDRAKQGLFIAGGSCIPGLPYYESYLTGGYHFRLTNRKGRFAWQLRLGAGVLPYGELDGQALGFRPALHTSTDLLWLVKEAR